MLYRIKGSTVWYVEAKDAYKAGERNGYKVLEKFDGGDKWEPYLAKEFEKEIAKKEILIEEIKKKCKKK